MHDLPYQSSSAASSVNVDTDFKLAPEVQVAKVLRDVVWRILWLRVKFGTIARIVLSKIDATDAFQQIAIEWLSAPLFG